MLENCGNTKKNALGTIPRVPANKTKSDMFPKSS